MSRRIKVAVYGASGYTGLELLRFLSRHPAVELEALTSREYQGQPVGQVFPSLAGIIKHAFVAPEPELGRRVEVAFTAVPHQTAMGLVPALLAAGCRVVDLSADFRLREQAVYEKWYQTHTAPHLLREAVYGLPELHGQELPQARLVGNPGCYPTCVILGLAPLVKAKVVDLSSLIADCKSGVSGAGRGASLTTSFCEVYDSFKAYKVAEHRHTPEMEQELSLVAQATVKVTFTPHLAPMSRGILGTLYGSLNRRVTEAEVVHMYQEFYHSCPFVRLHPPGSWPTTQQVRGTNFCDLGFKVDEERGRVIVIAAIDNLARGAATQAIHNFNLMLGLPETMGLDVAPLSP